MLSLLCLPWSLDFHGKFDENEDFELHIEVKTKTNDDKRLVVASAVNSKQTARIYYSKKRASEAGAVGFFVRKGTIAVKKFELTTPKK